MVWRAIYSGGEGSFSMGHERKRSMGCTTRRQFLRHGLAGAAGLAAGTMPRGWLRSAEEPALPKDILAVPDRSGAAPAAPVGVVRCTSYRLDALKKGLS